VLAGIGGLSCGGCLKGIEIFVVRFPAGRPLSPFAFVATRIARAYVRALLRFVAEGHLVGVPRLRRVGVGGEVLGCHVGSILSPGRGVLLGRFRRGGLSVDVLPGVYRQVSAKWGGDNGAGV